MFDFKKAPKVCTDVAHRICRPEVTVARAERIIEGLGKLEVKKIDERYSFGYPVYVMSMREGRYMRTLGKGPTMVQAKASGLMEFIERYSSQMYRRQDLITVATWDEVEDRAIHPSELVPPLRPTQWDCIGTFDRAMVDLFSRTGGRGAAGSGSTLSDGIKGRTASFDSEQWGMVRDSLLSLWVPGHNLIKDEPVLVPACFVLLEWNIEDDDGRKLFGGGSSNGLASGNTMEEAVFMGVTEVLERDAQFNDMRTLDLRNFIGHTAVTVEDASNPYLNDLCKGEVGARSLVLTHENSAGIDLATFSSLLFYRIGDMYDVVVSGGTHLDPEYALLRAVTEFVQAAGVFQSHLAGERVVDELPLSTPGCELVVPNSKPHRSVSLDRFPDRSTSDVCDDLKLLLGELESRGYDVIAVNLTHPKLGVPVVRIIIPGLLPEVRPRIITTG